MSALVLVLCVSACTPSGAEKGDEETTASQINGEAPSDDGIGDTASNETASEVPEVTTAAETAGNDAFEEDEEWEGPIIDA